MSSPDTIQITAPLGTLYTFKAAGDTLPMHRHTAADVHITCIMRGRFRIHGPDPKVGDREYEAGAFIDWATGVDHEFIALTDNARIANFLKNGTGQ